MSETKNVLIFQGGFDGHEPDKIAERFAKLMKKHGYTCRIYDTLDILLDREFVKAQDLIIPSWTRGELSEEACRNLSDAVAFGTGLAGCHGGMCSAFRNSREWLCMTGGLWISHPGDDGVSYTVNIKKGSSPIIEGIEDFQVCSEQYYLLVDPAVEVLATTRFPTAPGYHGSNKPVDMPVVWTKFWGNGRVFYNSLGHHDDIFDNYPQAEILMERGLLWAAQGKVYAKEHHLTLDKFA